MIKTKVDFKGALFKGNIVRIADRELVKASRKGAILLMLNAKRIAPKFTGQYIRGITAKVTNRFGTIISIVDVVGPARRYKDIVEKGRRPGKFPPVDKMTEYARRKLRAGAKSKQVGFLIGRKIAREGIPGKFVLETARKTSLAGILRFFRIAEKQITRRLNKL